MSYLSFLSSLKSIACAGALVAGLCLVPKTAEAFPTFERNITLPSNGAEILTMTPDGRALTLDNTGVVSLETEVASGQFQTLGQLPNSDFSNFGASFVAVSPNGKTLAVGNGGGATYSNYQLGVFDLSDITQGRWLTASHYAGYWWDNRNILVSAGKFGAPSWVFVLDTQSTLAATPETTLIVESIGGASGGVSLDKQDNLITANGFKGAGPSNTGAVHLVAAADWKGAFNQQRDPVNFETEAKPLARALSGSSLGFDARGNLWVGGAVTYGDNKESGFAAQFPAALIQSVRTGNRTALDSRNNQELFRVDPDLQTSGQRYQVITSLTRDEVVVRESGTSNAYVYSLEPVAAPAPALGGLGGLAVLGVGLGGSVIRNRKRKLQPVAA